MMIKDLEGLNPQEYEHPLDKRALDTLENTPGLDAFVRKFYELGLERFFKLELVGSNLKVTDTSFPDLHDILIDVCQTLNLKQIPELYIRNNATLEGLTIGVDNPIVVLSTDAVEDFTLEELRFIIGREIGHIKSQHILYQEIGYLLPVFSDMLSTVTLGISGLVTVGLKIALINWQRTASYTADRAGLLACQDISVASMVLAKIAGLPKNHYDSFNLDDFVVQAREFEGFSDDFTNRFLKNASLAFRQEAWTIMRANEFFKWTDSGEYQRVLDRDSRIPLTSEITVNFCSQCGFKLEAAAKFCPECGEKLV